MFRADRQMFATYSGTTLMHPFNRIHAGARRGLCQCTHGLTRLDLGL